MICDNWHISTTLFCFVLWHINLCWLFNANTFSSKNSSGNTFNPWMGDKGIHTFPKGICPKVNVIAWQDFELTNYDSAVHPFNHYTTRTPPTLCSENVNKNCSIYNGWCHWILWSWCGRIHRLYPWRGVPSVISVLDMKLNHIRWSSSSPEAVLPPFRGK